MAVEVINSKRLVFFQSKFGIFFSKIGGNDIVIHNEKFKTKQKN